MNICDLTMFFPSRIFPRVAELKNSQRWKKYGSRGCNPRAVKSLLSVPTERRVQRGEDFFPQEKTAELIWNLPVFSSVLRVCRRRFVWGDFRYFLLLFLKKEDATFWFFFVKRKGGLRRESLIILYTLKEI